MPYSSRLSFPGILLQRNCGADRSFQCAEIDNGKFKAEHEAEALAEIENQLQFIDRSCNQRCHYRKFGGKAIFAHVEQYKATRSLN